MKPASTHPLFSFAAPVGMISGEHPMFPSVGGGHEALKHDLETMRVPFEEVRGHYNEPTRSFIVHGMPREHLIALGKKYGQEAVIHNEGGHREFHYANGPKVGQYHPGLGTHELFPNEPDDYYTSIPGHGHVRLHFDADQLRPAAVHAGSPAPASMHAAGPIYATKHEVLHGLYHTLKKAYITLDQLRAHAPTKLRAHGHSYEWHDGHTSHHPVGYGPGGVLISSTPKLAKAEPKHPTEGVASYHQTALPFGHIDDEAKASGGSDLTHYDYQTKRPQIDKLIYDHGFQSYPAGGKHGHPKLSERNYDTGHIMVGEDGDQDYRKVHELAHALTQGDVNKLYGEGRRVGKLGAHRTLREAQRAIHWEWLAAHKQRDLNKSIGLEVPDDVFHRELNTVMHDAVHRSINGQSADPSQEGFKPHAHKVPLETSLGMVRQAARNLGLTGEHDLLNKSENWSNEVADDKKTLTVPEALRELHKGLKEKVTEFEQKCLDLRKAELAKKSPPGRKEEVEKLKAKGLPASEAFGIAWKQQNEHGKPDTKKNDSQGMPDSAAPSGGVMAMSEMCKACGSAGAGCDCAKAESYAKGEYKPSMKCSETPMCKCGDCSRAERYAKGELKFKKDEPAGSGGPPDGPGVKDREARDGINGTDMPENKAVAQKPKEVTEYEEGGNDGVAVKKPSGAKNSSKKLGKSGIPSNVAPVAPAKAKMPLGHGDPLVGDHGTPPTHRAAATPDIAHSLPAMPHTAPAPAQTHLDVTPRGPVGPRVTSLPAASTPQAQLPPAMHAPHAAAPKAVFGKTEIKKAGMAPGMPAPKPAAPAAPKMGAGAPSIGAPKLPKPGQVAKPAAPVGGKPPAMGAGTPQMGKTEIKKTAISSRNAADDKAKRPAAAASAGKLMDNMLADKKQAPKEMKKDLTWDPAQKGGGAPTPKFGEAPGVASLNPGRAKPAVKLPSVAAKPVVANPNAGKAPLAPGVVTSAPTIQPKPAAPTGLPDMSGFKSVVKPDAAPAPAAQPGMFSQPPAAGRAVRLPGAHLTPPPMPKPTLKSEKKPKGKK